MILSILPVFFNLIHYFNSLFLLKRLFIPKPCRLPQCVSPYGYPGLTWFVEPQFPPSQLELLRLELIRF